TSSRVGHCATIEDDAGCDEYHDKDNRVVPVRETEERATHPIGDETHLDHCCKIARPAQVWPIPGLIDDALRRLPRQIPDQHVKGQAGEALLGQDLEPDAVSVVPFVSTEPLLGGIRSPDCKSLRLERLKPPSDQRPVAC